jgi:hypothetical protein
MKRKLLTETPVCPRERLVIISYTTGLSFAKERIGPLAAIITTVFYLLALYLFALPNTPENPFASIYSETLIKTTCQHLLLLVGFDTLIYRKYYDTPPILVGHQLAQERHYPIVEIQTDAQEVIKLMEDHGGGRSKIASICQEIKELGGFFTRIKFSFVGRLSNEAAHACAKMASSDRGRWLWINYTPAFLDAILARDCNPTV